MWASSRRLLLVLLTTVVAALLLASVSQAAYRVRIDSGRLEIDRATSDRVVAFMKEEPPNLVVTEIQPITKINAGSGCAQVTDQRARCPLSAISSIVANLGTAPDSLEGARSCMACLPVTRPMSVAAGNGNDELQGGSANDSLNGQIGDDELMGGPGGDVLTGGTGKDLALYSDDAHAGVPVTVVLDGFAGDGAAGENDLIAADVEGVVGTKRGDTLTGSVDNNTLDGFGGASGAIGHDTLRGNSGNDAIDATGGQPDTVSCGPGNDKASLDLVDPIPTDCEDISQAAVGQHPTVAISRRANRARGGRALRVRLGCPKKLRRGCRGKLSLRNTAGRSLGSQRYSRIRRGRSRRVLVPLNARGRRARRITAVARERDPNGKPKTTITQLRG